MEYKRYLIELLVAVIIVASIAGAGMFLFSDSHTLNQNIYSSTPEQNQQNKNEKSEDTDIINRPNTPAQNNNTKPQVSDAKPQINWIISQANGDLNKDDYQSFEQIIKAEVYYPKSDTTKTYDLGRAYGCTEKNEVTIYDSNKTQVISVKNKNTIHNPVGCDFVETGKNFWAVVENGKFYIKTQNSGGRGTEPVKTVVSE